MVFSLDDEIDSFFLQLLVLLIGCWALVPAEDELHRDVGKACHYIKVPNWKYASCSNRHLKRIPDNIDSNTTVLDLSYNSINEIRNKSFIKLVRLQKLNISSNKISFLEYSAFHGLTKLKVLKLTTNNLTISKEVFQPDIFKALQNLQELYLDDNLVNENSSYLHESIGKLLKLKILHIPGLYNKSFGKGYLKLKSLTNLTLYSKGICSITIVRNDTFKNTPHLKMLNISNCNIKNVSMCSFCTLTKLDTLDMSHNCPGGLKLIRNITYGLQFTNVTVMRFTDMENPLKVGKAITKHDLEYANRTKIERLYIAGNMIEDIEQGSIELFPPNLQKIDISDNRPIPGAYIVKLIKLENLKILKADRLNMYHYFQVPGSSWLNSKMWPNKTCFNLPPRLEKLSLRNSRIPYDFVEINFCDDNSLHTVKLDQNAMSKWKGPLRGLNKLKYADLSVNLCETIHDDFFINMSSIISLNLRKNFIGYVIETNIQENKIDCIWIKPLKRLVKLDLSLNKIRTLPPKCFSTQFSLEMLNLKENFLSNWEVDIRHMENISDIDLSGNGIKGFPKDTTDHLSEVSKRKNVSINLSGNELECTCENIDFLKWFNSANVAFIGKENYTCRDRHGKIVQMKNTKQILANLNVACADYTFLNTILSIVIAGFMFIVLYAIYYRYRWNIKYFYYMTWGHYNLVQKLDKEKYYYDAYISYSEEDHSFVEGTLAPKLEQLHKLSLYLFDRDGIPGHYVHASILNNIEISRKTIVVFTKSYLKNERCLFELNMTIQKQMRKKITSQLLYVIELESVPGQDIPEESMALLNTGTYIEYPPSDPQSNTIFWERLKSTIKPLTEETAV